jgi:hypothetical protein
MVQSNTNKCLNALLDTDLEDQLSLFSEELVVEFTPKLLMLELILLERFLLDSQKMTK